MASTAELVPRWRTKGVGSVIEQQERPALISIGRMGAMLRGQILSISITHAEILPDDICHLFRKTNANVRFHFGDVAFSLTGLAISCEPRRTIVLEFDKPTRTNLAMLRNLGILPNSCATAEASQSSLQRPTMGVAGQRSKEDQRIVLHLSPPDGIERRVEPRFNFGTRASLFLCESGNTMDCDILEMSRTGCRLFADTPFLLPEDMQVEVAFQGNGQSLRFAGLIRPKLDAHLAGLLFVDLNARRQVSVDDLVEELKARGGRGASYLDI